MMENGDTREDLMLPKGTEESDKLAEQIREAFANGQELTVGVLKAMGEVRGARCGPRGRGCSRRGPAARGPCCKTWGWWRCAPLPVLSGIHRPRPHPLAPLFSKPCRR